MVSSRLSLGLALAVLAAATAWVWQQGPLEEILVADSKYRIQADLPRSAPRPVAQGALMSLQVSRAALPSIPMTLSVNASIELAEQADVQLLADAAKVQLTREEQSALARVTAHLEAVRQAYEASIATARVIERGHYRIEVPAYPAAGDELRAMLRDELELQLGEARTDQILAHLGSALEGRFGGFGLGIQTLDFRTSPGAADADYEVTRTVTFWNSFEANDRPTTRRETHFPGIEDPRGHVWGPFLALLAARVADRARS